MHGVVTNIDFMQTVLETDDFKQGKISTRWVEKSLESGSLLPDVQKLASGLHTIIAAALADVLFVGGKARPAVSNATDPFNPWKQTGNYRN